MQLNILILACFLAIRILVPTHTASNYRIQLQPTNQNQAPTMVHQKQNKTNQTPTMVRQKQNKTKRAHDSFLVKCAPLYTIVPCATRGTDKINQITPKDARRSSQNCNAVAQAYALWCGTAWGKPPCWLLAFLARMSSSRKPVHLCKSNTLAKGPSATNSGLF